MTSWNCSTEDGRNPPRSSAPSTIPSGWYDQLGGDDSPLAEAILDRIMHDAYKINIVPTAPLKLSLYEKSIRIGSGAERIIINRQLAALSWRFYSSGWRLRHIHYMSGTVIFSLRTGDFPNTGQALSAHRYIHSFNCRSFDGERTDPGWGKGIVKLSTKLRSKKADSLRKFLMIKNNHLLSAN